MKKIIKHYSALYKTALHHDIGTILFPISGAVYFFIQNITSFNFEVKNLLSPTPWIKCFITSLFIFMIFEVFFSKIRFFNKNKYLKSGLSFVLSTFIGEAIVLTFRNPITTKQWIGALVFFVLGFIGLSLLLIMGASLGKEVADKKALELTESYYRTIKQIPVEDRKILIKECEKALKLDDFVINIISDLGNKAEIRNFKNELLAVDKLK